MKERGSREYYLDILRIVAMLAVVCNHTWGYFNIDQSNIYNNKFIWYIDGMLVTMTRFDVPIFFMISGYLMIGNEKYSNLRNVLAKVIRGGAVNNNMDNIIYNNSYIFVKGCFAN